MIANELPYRACRVKARCPRAVEAIGMRERYRKKAVPAPLGLSGKWGRG